jgi:serine/threonine-protein kinase HipA
LGRKTSTDDLFGLLAFAGHESVGDVRLDVHPVSLPTVDLTLIHEVSFEAVLKASIDYSRGGESRLLPGQGFGCHGDVASAIEEAPLRGSVLKLEPEGLPRLVQNEYFFMALAKKAGLEVAQTQLVSDRDGVAGLVVERFDRRAETPHRLHVEDACQFLGRYPADKYRLTFAQVGEGVARYSSAPSLELGKMLRLLAFSYLIANGDLHGRNISLIVSRTGLISLAPAYDLLTTLPYGDRRLALEVEGRDDSLRRTHLLALAGRWAVTPSVLNRELDRILAVVADSVSNLGHIGFTAKQTAHLARVMMKRCEDLS